MTALAETLHRVGTAELAPGANPAGGDLVESFERFVMGILFDCGLTEPGAEGRAVGDGNTPRRGGEPRSGRHLPPPTTRPSAGPLDAARLELFIDRTWAPPLKKLLKQPTLRWTEIDRLGALPLIGTLTAWHQGWVHRTEALRLSVVALFTLFGVPRRREEGVGKLLPRLGAAPEARILRDGLLHQALTSWVALLDAEESPERLLWRETLREWAGDLRDALGPPSSWIYVRRRRSFSEYLSVSTDLRGPAEEDGLELQQFLSGHGIPASDFQLDTPPNGSLLWTKAFGWGVSCAGPVHSVQGGVKVFVLSRAETVLFDRAEHKWVRLDEPGFRSKLPPDCVFLADRMRECARATRDALRLRTLAGT